jgi:hypothetical protein
MGSRHHCFQREVFQKVKQYVTSEQAASRVQKVGERNPVALALAQLLSFAALAEPALIRRVRLDLLPESSAADEADLWFCNLIQSRSPAGLVFFPEVAQILREALPIKSRAGAWERTRQMHRDARRALQIEEELTYLGLEPASNKARIDELLRTVISAMVGGRTELANWAGRAVARLPFAVQNFESASVLRIAADLRLGRNPDLRERLARAKRIPEWMAAALPLLPRIRLAVTLKNREISLGPIVTAPSGHTIEVPDTSTIPVEVSWTELKGRRSKVLFVEKGEISTPERVAGGVIELVTLANETWTLRPTSARKGRTSLHPLTVSAYTDGSSVTLHWRSREPIPGCLGFAVMRQRYNSYSGGPVIFEEALAAHLKFDPDIQLQQATQRGAPVPLSKGDELSTQHPYQRFAWVDRPRPREVKFFSYRVIPMVGRPGFLQPLETLSSPWTPLLHVGLQADAPVLVAFNRTLEKGQDLGLSAKDIQQISGSPFRSNVAPPSNVGRTVQTFHSLIAQPGNAVRRALGGDLLSSLIDLLSRAISSASTVYAAMFELDDPEIVQLLERLGNRANIILATGDATPDKPDTNREVRVRLKSAGVQVSDRTMPSGRLAHNKFLVLCDSAERPQTVWTGNVSWNTESLCVRSNVACTVESQPIARAYLDYWNRIKAAANSRDLATANSKNFLRGDVVGGSTVSAWFTPVPKLADIASVAELVRKAQQGILFLLSEPGERGSLVNTIVEQENLHVMGVVRNGPSLTLYQGQKQTRLTGKALSFPLFDLLEGTSRPTLTFGSTLQSRMVVIDPMGSYPMVLIGSHGFGARGSVSNDENFLLIERDHEVAQRCAAHIDAFCQHYRMRIAPSSASGSEITTLLRADDTWQQAWFTPAAQAESAFWMAENSRTFVNASRWPVKVAAKKATKRQVRKTAPKPAKKTTSKKPAKRSAKKK